MNVRRRENWMWAEACALLDEAERRHRQFFGLLNAPARVPTWEPPVDMFSDGAEVQVLVALPGAQSEEIQIELMPGGLQIEARVLPSELGAGMKLLRLEIPYGRMRRRVDLPPGHYVLVERRLERGRLLVRLRRLIP
jgi:HSP20 family molecular chaperone IbpA